MACNRDEYCNTIARNYGEQISELNNQFKFFEINVPIIGTTLTEMEIPDDYLGSKVTEKVNELIESFQKELTDISELKDNIITYATTKKDEHLGHYNQWVLNNSVDGEDNG